MNLMFKRRWRQLRFALVRSPMKRIALAGRKGWFGSVGKRCMMMDRKLPLHSELVFFGENVWVATNVQFITHDVFHHLAWGFREKIDEKVGPIIIGNNVLIGSAVTLLYDVKIGDNVIIGAGSVVTKDVPSNSVVAGCPAKVIGSFEDFHRRRLTADSEMKAAYEAAGLAPHEELIIRPDEAVFLKARLEEQAKAREEKAQGQN